MPLEIIGLLMGLSVGGTIFALGWSCGAASEMRRRIDRRFGHLPTVAEIDAAARRAVEAGSGPIRDHDWLTADERGDVPPGYTFGA